MKANFKRHAICKGVCYYDSYINGKYYRIIKNDSTGLWDLLSGLENEAKLKPYSYFTGYETKKSLIESIEWSINDPDSFRF